VLTNVKIGGADPGEGNTAANGGGMFNGGGSNPVLKNGTEITGNTANGSGGGMSNDNSSPVLTNVTISENKTTDQYSDGGGMNNSNGASPVLVNVTISGNKADFGGGMHNSHSSPVLINVTISGNIAPNSGDGSDGGGMRNSYSSPALINVTISGNTAAYRGGGMYNEDNSSPALVNALISGNTAGLWGGGIFSNGTTSNPALINVTISGNTASSGNEISYSQSTPVIRNSIIWGSIYNISGGMDVEDSIIQGSDPDPKFAAPSVSPAPTTDGDYSLQSGSPAINVGDDDHYPIDSNGNWDSASSVYTTYFAGLDSDIQEKVRQALTKDLGGDDRFNGVIDMGAYEYQVP
jgi:hypothetical protein